MSTSPFSLGTKILAAGAALLGLFLLVGYLLPAGWDAEGTTVVDAPPEVVFGFLDSPEGWQQWTPWPDSGLVRTGPDRGAGARLSWNDPEIGSGSFAIRSMTPPEHVEYTIEVSGGSMHAEGVVTVTATDDGSRITWHEVGNLGHNPLMGYWALSMSRAQSQEMAKGLDRLSELVRAPPMSGVSDRSPDSSPSRSARDSSSSSASR